MAKIISDRTELARVSNDLHTQGKRIVTTNGVFDLLHAGHVHYLQFCKAQGDILIVGLNTDSSVKVNKGDKRPIIPEQERAEVLAALACVDYIHLFSEKTPEAWLAVIKPDVHVKGGDYALIPSLGDKRIIEKELVESLGGVCMVAPLVQGKGTTGIIEKIVSVFGPPK